MKCPICKLENSADSIKCDCGYNFQFCRMEDPAKGTAQAVNDEAEEDADQRFGQMGWIVAVLFGLMILGVVIANVFFH